MSIYNMNNKKSRVIQFLSKTYLKDAEKLGYTLEDLINMKTRRKIIEEIERGDANNVKRTLLKKYLEDAKKLGYTWKDLLNKQTRQKVTDEVAEYKSIKIKQLNKALKGYPKSFEISIINNKDPLKQLQNTRKAIEYHITRKLKSMKGLKFIETLMVTFKKIVNSEIVYKTAYFNSKPQTIINNVEIPEALQLSKEQILNIIAQWISEGSGWTIESVDNHHLNIVQYQPMKGYSYSKLPQELRNSSKGLINMKNEDNECFRWCHIRHLNPVDKDPQRIKKSDKQYIQDLDYTGIEFPVTTKQYNKIEKQNEIRINVFGYENKQPYPIYVSKEKYDIQMNLLLITENDNKHYVLIKDFNKFMYNQTKHKERKHFCMHCLQCFSSEIVLNNHKDNCIKVNGTQAVKMPDKDNIIYRFRPA